MLFQKINWFQLISCMSRLLSVFVVIVLFASCEKDIITGEQGNTGPEGTKGQPGVSAQVYVKNFNVGTNDWRGVNASELRESKLDIDLINQDNLNNLSVNVYLLEDREEHAYYNGYQRPLPLKNFGAVTGWFSFRTEAGGVVITYDSGNYTTSPIEDMTFKVVIGLVNP